MFDVRTKPVLIVSSRRFYCTCWEIMDLERQILFDISFLPKFFTQWDVNMEWIKKPLLHFTGSCNLVINPHSKILCFPAFLTLEIDHFRYIKILTWLRGLREKNKRNHMEVEGWIIYFFCFILPSLEATFEFYYIGNGQLIRHSK